MVLIPVITLWKDIFNFDINNQDLDRVLNAFYFSSYNGIVVIKLPIENNAFSYGVIVLGEEIYDENTIKHEYGHYLQLKELGLIRYTRYVFLPSLISFWRDVEYNDYYSLPWEYGADLYGEVNRDSYKYHSDTLKNYYSYWNYIK